MSGSQGHPNRVRKEGRKQYSISLGENREAKETNAFFQGFEKRVKKLNIKKSRPELVTYMVEAAFT